MTDIEALAREAGGLPVWFDTDNQPTATEFSAEALTRFAALVRAQALEDAALVCESIVAADEYAYADECAKAVRALKDKP